MKRTKIALISNTVTIGDEILIRAWVRTRRDSKTFSFLNLNDGSNLSGVQVIVDASIVNYADILRLTTGASVEVIGVLAASQGQTPGLEIQAKSISI